MQPDGIQAGVVGVGLCRMLMRLSSPPPASHLWLLVEAVDAVEDRHFIDCIGAAPILAQVPRILHGRA
jgi:hypothetical protein